MDPPREREDTARAQRLLREREGRCESARVTANLPVIEIREREDCCESARVTVSLPVIGILRKREEQRDGLFEGEKVIVCA